MRITTRAKPAPKPTLISSSAACSPRMRRCSRRWKRRASSIGTAVPQIWEADQRSPLFTTCTQAGFNPNTAPEPVLMAYIIGLTHDNEVQVLEKRAQTPFRNSVEFGAAANVITPNDAFFFSFIPGQCVTVDVTDRTSNERTRFSLSVRPFNRLQPWQVDYAYKIPSRFHDAVEHPAPQDTFPTPETLSLRESDDNGAAGVK